MTTLLLTQTRSLPQSPVKSNHSEITTYSPQSLIHEEYYTPPTSAHISKISSDSDSTSTAHISTDNSDYEDFVNTSTDKNVRFASPSISKVDIQVKLENDEAEFFAVISPKDTTSTMSSEKNDMNKSTRKRDKIRSLFNKTFHRSNSDSFDTNTNEWNEIVAKTLISMHQDMQDIVDGFDQMDQPVTDTPLSNSSEPILTTPRLSFHERQRAKIHMMRMAQMLHPPNLLTCDMKESPYPYTDIVEPRNFNLLRPNENPLIQHKPFRHKKFRYRTQRGLLRAQHDLKKLKRDLYGKSAIKSHKELPSLDVQNYRNRLEKTLLEVRTQIAEYDRIHSTTNNHRQSISHIIAKMKGIDPDSKSQIEDYRTKLRPIEYIDKKQKNDLISAPFIPRRARYRPNTIKKDDNDSLIDTRFDPDTFIDLNEESATFFGSDIPFWNQSPDATPSSSPSTVRRRSNHFTLSPKVGFVDRFVYEFKAKQKHIRTTQSNETKNYNDDDFFDCTSPPILQRKSQSLLSPSNNEHDSIDF